MGMEVKLAGFPRDGIHYCGKFAGCLIKKVLSCGLNAVFEKSYELSNCSAEH